MYRNLTDRLKCIKPQILFDKIENETGSLGMGTNIFILLTNKYEKPTPEAGYKNFNTTNKEM